MTAHATTTTFPNGSSSIISSVPSSTRSTIHQLPSQSPAESPAESLTAAASSLQPSVISVNDSFRDAILQVPIIKSDILLLSRELVQIISTCRLLVRHATSLPPASDNNGLPDGLVLSLRDLVNCVGELVTLSGDTVDSLRNNPSSLGERPDQDPRRLKIVNFGVLLSTAQSAFTLGIDALNFALSSGSSGSLPDDPTSLPTYQSTQLLQDAITLRLRSTSISSPSNEAFPPLKFCIIEFIDFLQQHIEQTCGTLLVPPPIGESGTGSNNSPSRPSSLHSDQIIPTISFPGAQSQHISGAVTPNYSPITVNLPAPGTITIRHSSKRDVAFTEVFQVAFTTRDGKSVTVASTGMSATLFYQIGSQTGIQGTLTDFGSDIVFGPAGSNLWAYRQDEDILPNTHYHQFPDQTSKPVVFLANHSSGRKYQKYRWSNARPLAFSPDGRMLAMVGPQHRIGLLDTSPNAPLKDCPIIHSHVDTVTHAIFTPDSHALISISVDGTICLTDPFSLESLAKLDLDTNKKPLFLGVAPDSDLVVAIVGDTVYRWHHPTGALESYSLPSRRGKEGVPIALSPDCRFIACRFQGGVDVTDAHEGRILFTIRFQSGFATAAAFSNDGHYLALGKAAASSGMRTSKSMLDIWELVF